MDVDVGLHVPFAKKLPSFQDVQPAGVLYRLHDDLWARGHEKDSIGRSCAGAGDGHGTILVNGMVSVVKGVVKWQCL